MIYHKPALTWLKDIESTKTAIILKSGIFQSELEIKLCKESDSFNFTFDYEHHFYLHGRIDLGILKQDLLLTIRERDFIATDVFFNKHSPTWYSGAISELYTKGYKKSTDYYYRMFIPLEDELKFHYSIEEHGFKTDLGYWSRTGTKCAVSDDDIIVSVIHDDQKNYYLTLESKLKQSFNLFTAKAFAVQNALAYITGYYAGGSSYYFMYETSEMTDPMHLFFQTCRPTIKSVYQPIYINPHGSLYHDRELAEKWYTSQLLRPLSTEEFSKFADLIYTSQDFASAVILIIESSVASLLFMPGGYAIALETIAPLIVKKKRSTFAPVSDRKIWKSLKDKLLEVIQTFEKSEPNHKYQILISRINSNLNSASNQSMLSAPFDQLGIQLEQEDLTILDARNDFLHGRVPDLTKAGKDRALKQINSDLYYSALRFYTLLSMLILKWIGYDNYVLNYPKLYEAETGRSLQDEEPYRKV